MNCLTKNVNNVCQKVRQQQNDIDQITNIIDDLSDIIDENISNDITAVNLGTGNTILVADSSPNFQFRSITAGSGITILEGLNELQISSLGATTTFEQVLSIGNTTGDTLIGNNIILSQRSASGNPGQDIITGSTGNGEILLNLDSTHLPSNFIFPPNPYPPGGNLTQGILLRSTGADVASFFGSENRSSGNSGSVFIRSGTNTGTTSGDNTGSLQIITGDLEGDGSNAQTGSLFILSGTIRNEVGTNPSSGNTGPVFIGTGDIQDVNGTGNTGTLFVNSGQTFGSGTSGDAFFSSGNIQSGILTNTNTTGSTFLSSGTNFADGNSGTVNIFSGNSSNGTSGDVLINTGIGLTTGNIRLITPPGTTDVGNIVMSPGNNDSFIVESDVSGNTTRVEMLGGKVVTPIEVNTGGVTLVQQNQQLFFLNTTAGDIDINLPPLITGTMMHFIKIDNSTNSVTFTGVSGASLSPNLGGIFSIGGSRNIVYNSTDSTWHLISSFG